MAGAVPGLLPGISRNNPESDFELIKQIGSGGYGVVYKAKIVANDKLCAVKVIKIKPGEDFNTLQQEIKILSECKHPNIVGYFGSYLRKDKLWIAMEYCGAGSIYRMCHALGTGLNELQIAFICRETLQGLSYLHERNKIHRDIKGANILITDDRAVKLADFGIAAQLTQTLGKRKTFIGTPYWMAPEVAAVEKKGTGYSCQCDIWALGITAIELAEMQPPLYDVHPMKVLQVLTKWTYRPPVLQHKNKWSNNFHDFVAQALKKDPKSRPNARDLLKHEFVARDLTGLLLVPLIKALETSPTKSTNSTTGGEQDKGKRLKRIASLKRFNLDKDDMPGVSISSSELTPNKDTNSDFIPAWLDAAAHGSAGFLDSGDYHTDTDLYNEYGNNEETESNFSFGGIKPFTGQSADKAHFTPVFKGCPLTLHCACVWTHPVTQICYILLGAEEGLFSLQVIKQLDPIMEQVSEKSCRWLRVVENVLVWLSNSDQMISLTNLILLFQDEDQEISDRRSRIHTSKIRDSMGCTKCCVVQSPYTNERYLVAAVARGILILQWYQLRHTFMHVKLLEHSLPVPLSLFEAFVTETDKYPLVCVKVKERDGGHVNFDIVNASATSPTHVAVNKDDDETCSIPPYNDDEIIELRQIDRQTILIADHRGAKFVDLTGSLRLNDKRASLVRFEKRADSVVYLQNCILYFHKNGMQGKSLLTQSLVADINDDSKEYRLLGSHGAIIVEIKESNDPPSIYLLE